MICPACSSSRSRPVDNFSTTQPSTNFFPDSYTLHSCEDCGLWFKNYASVALNVQEYYNRLNLVSSNWNYPQKLPHEKKLDVLLSKLPDKARVLDVGCWTGRLLSSHTNLQRFGIEPNDSSARIARENGLEIVGPGVDSLKESGQKYDLILLIDVFEHLPDPTGTIQTLTQCLELGGRLLIITGRANCIPVKLAGSTYWYFSTNPDHIIFLNKKFLNWLGLKYPSLKITAKGIRHYNFTLKRFSFELLWLTSWRFLNPNSPFKKTALQKAGIFKNLENVKEITMCTSWHDHYLVEIKKER